MTDPLVVEDLTVVYPDGHRALDGVGLRIADGERWAVVGRSGSGKTTLLRAVLGLLPAGTRATGSVRVAGHEVLGRPERELRALRGPVVGYVAQDPFAACDPLRTIAHHVGEAWTAHGRPVPADRVPALLGEVDIPEPGARCRQRPHQWSGGMLQRATLVAGTAHTPPLTLADEPTSALDTELADGVLALVARRCGALLLVSHDLALVARHAGAVLVLADGRAVERGPAARLLAAPQAPETAALVAAAVPAPRPVTLTKRAGEPVVEARGVTRRYGTVTAVAGVDLAVHRGEVLGVVGPSGSGKSTLGRLLAGMEAPDGGTVRHGGRRPGYVMPVFQDPVGSLDRRWALWRSLTEPLLARGERHPRARRRALAAAALERVGLAGIDVDRLPGSLSVGQAQRVAVARALAADPALLVADEPTASLDVATAAAVAALLRRVADDGAAVVVISHDRPRLASYADRVVELRAGRITPPEETAPREEIDDE